LIAAIGVAAGIYMAEYIRKKHGLPTFFAKLLSTPELDRDNKPGESEKK
jgi:hypothetical protein